MSKSLASALMVVILLSSQSVLMLYSDEMESMDEDSLKLESVSRNIAITDVPTWQVGDRWVYLSLIHISEPTRPY